MAILPPLNAKSFHRIRQYLYRICGIDLAINQIPMVESRLGVELYRSGYRSWTTFTEHLEQNQADAIEVLVNCLTTNKTHFFRESKHFEYLCKIQLPEWQRLRKKNLCAWSAATSNGAEAYSLAMLFEEFRNKESNQFSYKILATDINTEVLAEAQAGIYPKEMAHSELKPELLKKYFLEGTGKNKNRVKFRDEYTSQIKFRKFNIAQPVWQLPVNFDVIFLRNVLIYFNEETVSQILQNCYKSLNPDGLLILGYSESALLNHPKFDQLGTSIFQKGSSKKQKQNSRPIRIAIIEDSKVIQKILNKTFQEDRRFEVVGLFNNPVDAMSILKSQQVDVITLDIDMPKMNGVDFLAGPWKELKIPTIMVTSHAVTESSLAIRALELGAFDCVTKPKMNELDGAVENIKSLARQAAGSRPFITDGNTVARREEFSQDALNNCMIAIGASTGGTVAIQKILGSLHGEIPPIVIGQHIPAGFSAAFASHLNLMFDFEVIEIKDGMPLKGNTVFIAPGGLQTELTRTGHFKVREMGLIRGHAPSIDQLFSSMTKFDKREILAMVLTGMGDDGAAGLLKLKNEGAITLVQDRASSAVYGMPKAAAELGGADHQLGLDEIPAFLTKYRSENKSSA